MKDGAGFRGVGVELGYDVAIFLFDDAAFGTSRLGPAVDTNPPSIPANLVATATSPFAVDLSWNASTDDVGVTGYDVFRDGVQLVSLGATTSYTDTTALASSTYDYAVRARDGVNVSALSAAASVTTPSAAGPLFADGFESGNLGAWTSSGGLTVESTDVRSGGFAAEANTTNGGAFAKLQLLMPGETASPGSATATAARSGSPASSSM